MELLKNKPILITTIVAAVLVAALAYLLFAPSGAKPVPAVEVEEVATPSPSPTPELSAPPDFVYEEHIEDVEAQNPVVSNVPKITPYWMVEITQDPRDGKLVLTATAFVKAGQSQEEMMNRQRPYIESWLNSIGQLPGTYELDMRAQRIDDEFEPTA